MGGSHAVLFWAIVLLLVMTSKALGGVQTYWLGYWAQQYEGREEGSVDVQL